MCRPLPFCCSAAVILSTTFRANLTFLKMVMNAKTTCPNLLSTVMARQVGM